MFLIDADKIDFECDYERSINNACYNDKDCKNCPYAIVSADKIYKMKEEKNNE